MIDRYLGDDLTKGERTDFDRLLAKDKSLRRRVSLRKDLVAYLSGKEASMADFLERADRAHFESSNVKNEPASAKRAYWWWLLLVLIGLAGLVWWFAGRSARGAPSLPPPEPQRQTTVPVLGDTLDQSVPDVVPPPAPSTSPAPATARPKVDAPKTDAVPQQPTTDIPVFAQLDPADFTPYPLLEDMAGGQLRGGIDSTSLVLVPATDTIFLAALERAKLKGYSTVEPPYEVLIFDNQERNFMEDRSVLHQRTEGAIQGDGYAFDVDLSTLTRNGRFYVLVLDEEGELLTGKVIFARQ